MRHTRKDMQKSSTKEVNGVTLNWSDVDQKWEFPVPESAQVRLLLDESTGKFLPVLNHGSMVFRQREATAPDGTRIIEQTVFRDTQEATPETLAAQKRAILARQLEAKLQLWESLVQLRPLIVGGMFVTMCAAFWAVFSAVDAMAGMIAKSVVLALTELAYFAVWIVGGLAVLFIVRAVVLYAFSSRAASTAEDIPVGQQAQETAKDGNINVIIQQGGGLFGAQSPAQQILTNR